MVLQKVRGEIEECRDIVRFGRIGRVEARIRPADGSAPVTVRYGAGSYFAETLVPGQEAVFCYRRGSGNPLFALVDDDGTVFESEAACVAGSCGNAAFGLSLLVGALGFLAVLACLIMTGGPFPQPPRSADTALPVLPVFLALSVGGATLTGLLAGYRRRMRWRDVAEVAKVLAIVPAAIGGFAISAYFHGNGAFLRDMLSRRDWDSLRNTFIMAAMLPGIPLLFLLWRQWRLAAMERWFAKAAEAEDAVGHAL